MQLIGTSIVPIASLCFKHDLNMRDALTVPEKAYRTLFNSLVSDGWSAGEVLRCVREKDDSLRPLEGHLRSRLIPAVNKERESKGLEPIDMIPVSVVEGTEAEYLEAMIQSNTNPMYGQVVPSWKDRVESARRRFDLGDCKEADLCRLYKRGEGQRLFALCRLDSQHKSLGIIDSVLSGEEAEYRALDKESLRKLAGSPARGSKAAVPAASEEDVKAYFEAPREAKKSMISRTDLEACLHDKKVVGVVALAVQAILDGDLVALKAAGTPAPAEAEAPRKRRGRK